MHAICLTYLQTNNGMAATFSMKSDLALSSRGHLHVGQVTRLGWARQYLQQKCPFKHCGKRNLNIWNDFD